MELLICILDQRAHLPTRTRAADAGFDLVCLDPIRLDPGERAVIGTGLALALPENTCGLIIPRSGLAAEHGISIVNAPGLIDPSYRGEVKIVLINTSHEEFQTEAGARIAQLLLTPFVAPQLRLVSELPSSIDGRAAGGFGSSGR